MTKKRGRKPSILVNDIKEKLNEVWQGRDDADTWPLFIDDIVSGVARLDWYGEREQQVPLSTKAIIKCFLCLDLISTQSVSQLLNLGERMARKYSAACRISHPFLKRSMECSDVVGCKYRRMSIVSVEHGKALGHHKQNRAMI